MSDEKETYMGPVEQEINSMMETAGNEIMDHTQREQVPKKVRQYKTYT
ncbi:MAG: hypothetical protein L6305_03945 [Actinomycetia bacterium]|nr:hypothetical protein [Actinomycetes bacterium]